MTARIDNCGALDTWARIALHWRERGHVKRADRLQRAVDVLRARLGCTQNKTADGFNVGGGLRQTFGADGATEFSHTTPQIATRRGNGES